MVSGKEKAKQTVKKKSVRGAALKKPAPTKRIPTPKSAASKAVQSEGTKRIASAAKASNLTKAVGKAGLVGAAGVAAYKTGEKLSQMLDKSGVQLTGKSKERLKGRTGNTTLAEKQKAQAAKTTKKSFGSTPTPKAKPKVTPKKKANTVTGTGSKTVNTKRGTLANVTKEQLKSSGLTLTQYMNKWNKTGKRP